MILEETIYIEMGTLYISYWIDTERDTLRVCVCESRHLNNEIDRGK